MKSKKKRRILTKICAGTLMSAVLAASGLLSLDAQAAVSRTWDTFYISYSNKQMSQICAFPYYLGKYVVKNTGTSGTGAGISNLIQGVSGTSLEKASYVVNSGRPQIEVLVTNSGVTTTYISSTLSFNVGSGTAHTTGTISHQ